MHVIGTAGHVDHGKSTLIAALTGSHPDRLKEEQEREMTIELGFGWMQLQHGPEVGIIDVPGHRDFIENMLAGIGGIDAVLLVIAADEGVMPQTREHLAILDLLQIKRGLVVISKVDMVKDDDWLDLVEADIESTLVGTSLQNAKIIRVSARTGFGLDALKSSLGALLTDTPARLDLGRPRLPIDRIFSIAGFGTVVTGTLLDGHLTIGEEVEILPSGKKARIRGLQTHKKKEDTAISGSRTAVNISGVAVEEISRGEVLATPGHYQAGRRFDGRMKIMPDASGPLKNGTEIKVFTGTSESIASVRTLGTDSILPGEEGWIQMELRHPLVLVRGDRFIIRRPSPSETIGGGQVIDPTPKQRHKRFDEEIIHNLETLSKGSPADVLLQAAHALGAAPARDVVARAHLEPAIAREALWECLHNGVIVSLESENPAVQSDDLLLSASYWTILKENIRQALASFHQAWPLKRGMPREELKSKLKLSARLFNAAIKQLDLQASGSWLALPGHAIQLGADQQAKANALLVKFKATPYSPPGVKECQKEIGEDLFSALLELGEITQVSPEVAFRRGDYETMVSTISQLIREKGKISAAEVRDVFNNSRKYSLALLEHLDAVGVTVRDGDFRKLRH